MTTITTVNRCIKVDESYSTIMIDLLDSDKLHIELHEVMTPMDSIIKLADGSHEIVTTLSKRLVLINKNHIVEVTGSVYDVK